MFVDFSAEAESSILSLISTRPNLTNHFPKIIGTRNVLIDGATYGEITMERVHGREFHVFADKCFRNRDYEVVRGLVAQTLCVVELLRRELGIVHNDLHASNVLVVPTDEDVASFDFDGTRYEIETRGYRPVIIDFGLAYFPDFPNYSASYCTNLGYAVDEPDPLADCRIFLAGVVNVMRSNGVRDALSDSLFDRFFGPLKLDKGWFNKNASLPSLIDEVKKYLEPFEGKCDGTVFCLNSNEHKDLIGLLVSGVGLTTRQRRLRNDCDDDVFLSDDDGNGPDGNPLQTLRRALLHRPSFSEKRSSDEQLCDVKALIAFELDEEEEETESTGEMRKAIRSVLSFVEDVVESTLADISEKKARMYGVLRVKNTVDILTELSYHWPHCITVT